MNPSRKVRAKIGRHECTLLLDEDRSILPQLTFGGKVDWLDARVKFALIDPCRAAMRDWHKNDMGLILVTSICAGISAASRFYTCPLPRGKGADKKAFVCFLTKWVGAKFGEEVPGENSLTWADWLYFNVRCGLAHAFTVEMGGFDIGMSDPLKLDSQQRPKVDAEDLLRAFEEGWGNYLAAVRRQGPRGPMGERFERRWDEVFLRSST